MHRLKPDVDIVLDILNAVLQAQPHSTFTRSLHHQYQERGGLSKKQLEGLLGKASRIDSIPEKKLATLEAIIKKKHTREKSVLPDNKPLYEKDEEIGKLISAILGKFPEHKRVLFLQSKYENDEVLAGAELAELRKFGKMLEK